MLTLVTSVFTSLSESESNKVTKEWNRQRIIYLPISGWLKRESHEDYRAGGQFYPSPTSSKQRNGGGREKIIYLPISSRLKGESHEDKRAGGQFYPSPTSSKERNLFTHLWLVFLQGESHEDQSDGGPFGEDRNYCIYPRQD